MANQLVIDECTVHFIFDLFLLFVAAAIVFSVYYLYRLFRGSLFSGAWKVILLAITVLFVGTIIDLALMATCQTVTVSAASIQEAFMLVFLVLLGYGFYSIAGQWKQMKGKT